MPRWLWRYQNEPLDLSEHIGHASWQLFRFVEEQTNEYYFLSETNKQFLDLGTVAEDCDNVDEYCQSI